MGCMLYVGGARLKIDQLLDVVTISPVAVFRRGEIRYESSPPEKVSGANFFVSNAGMDDVEHQVSDAVRFLRQHAKQVALMRDYPGVKYLNLDFGVVRKPVFIQSDVFPVRLLSIAAELGVSIMLSQYPMGKHELLAYRKAHPD